MDKKKKSLVLELISSNSSTICGHRGEIIGNIKINYYNSEFGGLKTIILSDNEGHLKKYIESPLNPRYSGVVEDKSKVDEFYSQDVIFVKPMSSKLVKKIKESRN